MSADNINKGFAVFTEARHIQLMECFRDYYQRAFANQADIEVCHKSVPALLDIHHEKTIRFPEWLFEPRSTGYLTQRIAPSQLELRHYRDLSAVYTRGINYRLSNSVIANGMTYIEAIEHNQWSRMLRHPFSKIHRPDYYLIVVIANRIKTLSKTTPSQALIQEYGCLHQFIDSLTEIVAEYFPPASFADSEPFHVYLQTSCQLIQAMSGEVMRALERRAIAEWLTILARTLDAYQYELAIYLAYCLSDAKLGQNLTIIHLTTDNRSLPADFVTSALYINLQRILLKQTATVTKTLTVNDAGISTLLTALQRINHQAVNQVLDHYHELLIALSTLFTLVNQLEALASSALSVGEQELINDKTLSLMLSTHLTMINTFVAACHQKMTIINTHNTTALTHHEAFVAGSNKNMKRAQRQTIDLQKIAKQLHEPQHCIQEKIEIINQSSAKELISQRHELVTNTEKLLTQLKRHAIIPLVEVDKLLDELQQQCGINTGGAALPSNPPDYDTLIKPKVDHFSEEITVNMPVQSMLAPVLEIVDPQSEAGPIGRQSTADRIAQQRQDSPFGIIYNLLVDREDKIRAFEAIIDRFYQQIDVVLGNFVTQLEKIHHIRLQIHAEIRELTPLKAPQKPSTFQRIDELLRSLTHEIQQTHYENERLVQFTLIDDVIVTKHRPKINLLYGELRTLLEEFVDSPYEEYTQAGIGVQSTPMQEILRPFQHHMMERSSAIRTRLRLAGEKVREEDCPRDSDITAHYQDIVNTQKNRLIPSAAQTPVDTQPPASASTKSTHGSLIDSSVSCQSAIPAAEGVLAINQPPTTLSAATVDNAPRSPSSTLEHAPAVPQRILEPVPTISPEPLTTVSPTTTPPPTLTNTATQGVANTIAQTSLTLDEIGKRLFATDANLESININLDQLCKHLRAAEYTLHYTENWVNLFGGSYIRLEDGTYKKVPRTIHKLINHYEHHCKTINNTADATTLRDELITMTQKAASNHFSWQCCFFVFQPRDDSTQQRYQTMARWLNQSSPT